MMHGSHDESQDGCHFHIPFSMHKVYTQTRKGHLTFPSIRAKDTSVVKLPHLHESTKHLDFKFRRGPAKQSGDPSISTAFAAPLLFLLRVRSLENRQKMPWELYEISNFDTTYLLTSCYI